MDIIFQLLVKAHPRFVELYRNYYRNFLISYHPQKKQKLQLEGAGRDEQKKRIADMGIFLHEQPTALTEYDHTPSGGCALLSGG